MSPRIVSLHHDELNDFIDVWEKYFWYTFNNFSIYKDDLAK